MKAFYQFTLHEKTRYEGKGARRYLHGGETIVEGYGEIQSVGTRFIKINGALRGHYRCNLLYVDGRRRIDIKEIVPEWWDDPLIVAIKVTEAKAKRKKRQHHERPVETSNQIDSAI